MSFDVSDLKVRFEITLGLYATARAYKKALLRNQCSISNWADPILTDEQLNCQERQSKLSLTVVTPREFGLTKHHHHEEVCERGVELGLVLCPPEAGSALALQIARLRPRLSHANRWLRWANGVDDQAEVGGHPWPLDDWHTLAMRPRSVGSSGWVFRVNRIISDRLPWSDMEPRCLQWLHAESIPTSRLSLGGTPPNAFMIFGLPVR